MRGEVWPIERRFTACQSNADFGRERKAGLVGDHPKAEKRIAPAEPIAEAPASAMSVPHWIQVQASDDAMAPILGHRKLQGVTQVQRRLVERHTGEDDADVVREDR